MKKFLKFLISSSGQVSCMRLLALVVIADIMTVWTVLCFIKVQMVTMPWDVVSILGIMITGKTISKFAEAQAEDIGPDISASDITGDCNGQI